MEVLAKAILTQDIEKAMEYGRALRICRAALKMSQQDVAKRARITTSYLSLIESGKRVPTLGTLEKVCKALGVPAHLVMLLAAGPADIPSAHRKKLGDVAKSLLELLAGPRVIRTRQ